MKTRFVIFFVAVVFVLSACQRTPAQTSTETPEAGMPNPASVYCEEQGGTLEIRTNADGSQYGVCLFEDGSECDEWAYFRGECQPGGAEIGMPNPASVYCEEQGGTLDIRTNADGSQYGVCVFEDGSECDEWAYFRGECQPAAAAVTPSAEPTTAYVNEQYGFSLDLPAGYTIEAFEHRTLFKRPGYLLFVCYKLANEVLIEPFRTGMSAGDIVDAGMVNVLGTALPKQHLVWEGKVKSVSYQPFQVGEVQFVIWLDAETTDYAALDIPAEVLAEADAIAAGLTLTSGELPQVSLLMPGDLFSGEEVAIAEALAEHLSVEVETLAVSIIKKTAQHVRGEIVNGYFLAAKVGETWVIVYDGQVLPACADIDAYAFPVDMVAECMGANGNLVNRSQVQADPNALDLASLGSPTWTDGLENGDRWYMVNTENVTFKMQDGFLLMNAAKAGGYDEWGMGSMATDKNFVLEVAFESGAQCSGIDRYGVVFHAPDLNKGYVFEFSCSGSFRLYKWDGSTYKGLQEWKESAAILSGAGQKNRLGLMVLGNTFKLYANDRLLGEYTDETYSGGMLGLVVGSKNTDNLQVLVDSVSYWKLPQ